MKLFNWGKTEEQKEIEKRESFERNLKRLEPLYGEINEILSNRNLYNVATLNEKLNVYFIKKVRFPKFNDENNHLLKCEVTSVKDGRLWEAFFEIVDKDYFIKYVTDYRDNFLKIYNQLPLFGIKIVKDNE